MGKRITQQARGKGSLTFRVRPKAYRYKITYPEIKTQGEAKILKLINSPAHSAPLAKIKAEKQIFIIPAAENIYEGQKIEINQKVEVGNILKLKNVPIGTKIFNIESYPGSGGKYVRSSGSFATVLRKEKNKAEVLVKKRKIMLNENCRAVIGIIGGGQRKIKPLVKAGKQHHRMKSKGRKWHRRSPIKVNAVDHPYGGGRGKRIKSKIAKRNLPPGKKVGHIRPKRTGKK